MERIVDLLEKIPVGYLILRNNEEIVKVNSSFCSMVGMDREELISICFRDLVAPLYQDTFYYFFDLLQKENIPSFIEVKIRRKEKGDLFVRLDGRPEEVEDRCFSVVVTDISVNKDLEARLKKETDLHYECEEILRQVMARSGDVFFYQDLITREIIYINPQVTELLGYTQEECRLMSEERLIDLFLPEYRERYEELYGELLEKFQLGDHGWIEREFEMFAKSGEVKRMRGAFSLVVTKEGQISQLIGHLHDLAANAMYEKELMIARLKTEENEALKSAFLANMSHEIRTPLNSIIGFSSLLKEEVPKDSEIFEYVSVIESNGGRLLHVLNDVISISRIESNQLEIKKSLIEFSPILEEAYGIFYAEAANKELELRYTGCDPILIETDREKITSVVYNLIKNAVKYTEKGYVEFGAKAREDELYVYVKDSGIGIPQDKFNLIFDSFTQVNAMRFEEGIGLGLSICKGVVRLLGGDIGVESTYGEGSLFYFTLKR